MCVIRIRRLRWGNEFQSYSMLNNDLKYDMWGKFTVTFQNYHKVMGLGHRVGTVKMRKVKKRWWDMVRFRLTI